MEKLFFNHFFDYYFFFIVSEFDSKTIYFTYP